MGNLFHNYPLFLMHNYGLCFHEAPKYVFSQEKIHHQVIFECHIGVTRIIHHSSQIFFVTFVQMLSTEPK